MMRSRAVAFSLLGLVLLAPLGCGRSAEERQLEAMRDEIDKVREGRDRADHAAAPHDAAESSLVVPGAYTSAAPTRPPPPVVQLGEDGPGSGDDAVEADPQDTTPRPTIRVLGSARGADRSSRRGEEVVEEPSSDDGASGSSAAARAGGATALDPEAKRAYDAALALVNAKRFDQALDALAAFLVKWPDHPYADNAMYWRGECYFARGDYQHASEQFEGVLKRFPYGNKAPDALLKLGVTQQKLGNAAKARESFDRLARQYPESDAARHIPTPRVPASTPPGSGPEEHR
jgi:tol-pal system protein YbgF